MLLVISRPLKKSSRCAGHRTGPKRKSTPRSDAKETSGMTDQIQVPLVYVDANTFIYAIEGNEALANPIKALFARLRERPGFAVTSELSLAEVLPKAPSPVHRRSYLDLIIWSGIIDLRPVTREILIETADYRR